MKQFVRFLIAITLCLVLSPSLLAQTVNSYPTWRDLPSGEPNKYLANPSQILPDARTAFRKGDYSRAVSLCDMHWIAFGDESTETKEKDTLEAKAKKCFDLRREMNGLLEEGQLAEAKEKARAILTNNPQDENAKEILTRSEPAPADIVVTDIDVSDSQADQDSNPVTNVENDGMTDTVVAPQDTVIVEPEKPQPPVQPAVKKKKAARKVTFVAKAGVGFRPGWSGDGTPIDLDFAVGAHKLGGSPVGVEIGGFIGLQSYLYGVNASGVVSLAKFLSVRAGGGFFSYSHTSSATRGMNVTAGLDFRIGGHFCIDVGASYFPKIQVSSNELVTTQRVSYTMPVTKTVMKAGIVPSIKLGWAF
jgi:hypothetical protein